MAAPPAKAGGNSTARGTEHGAKSLGLRAWRQENEEGSTEKNNDLKIYRFENLKMGEKHRFLFLVFRRK